MKRKRLLMVAFGCFVAILPSFVLCENEKAEERAFYAISSLQSHVDTLLENGDEAQLRRRIVFEPHDVAHLWLKAIKSPFATEVDRAQSRYYRALSKDAHVQARLLKKVHAQLHHVWNASNQVLQKGAVSKKDSREDRFLLPQRHELRGVLDAIFIQGSPLKNRANFLSAGFKMICQRSSSMVVAKHNKLPGYLIKGYLDEEKNNSTRNRRWLQNRCLGAENIRNLIAQKKIKFFTVPDKWIYILPGFETFNDQNNALLVVSDMQLASNEKTKWAWKNAITKQHLDELYCILSHGFASTYLIGNIPYTKSGNFTCIDTEYPERLLPYHKVSSHLSDEMRAYWEKLVKHGGTKKFLRSAKKQR